MASENSAYILTRTVGFTVYIVSGVRQYPVDISEKCPGHDRHCCNLVVFGPGSSSVMPNDYLANYSDLCHTPSYEYRRMDNTGLVIFRPFCPCSGQVGI